VPGASSLILRKSACKHLIGKRISRDRRLRARFAQNDAQIAPATAQIFLPSREISLFGLAPASVWAACNNRPLICVSTAQNKG
jgi:hypothetical protein